MSPSPAAPMTVIYHRKADLYRDLLTAATPELSPVTAHRPEELARVLPDAEILISMELPVAAAPLARKLRWLQLTSAGVELVLPAREWLGDIAITNARGIHSDLMADHVLAAMVMLNTDFPGLLRNQAARIWHREPRTALAGKTLGVVGAGAIGAEIGRRASHFGMRVLGVRRGGGMLPGFEAVVGRNGLADVLGRSDFVCVAVPATDETQRMIGAAEFAAMKPSAFFINIARGTVVDEPALIAALAGGTIAGAALDVFEKEPLDRDSPLWSMPNVIITPHIAGMEQTNEARLVEIFAENLGRYRSGEPLRNVVDLGRGY